MKRENPFIYFLILIKQNCLDGTPTDAKGSERADRAREHVGTVRPVFLFCSKNLIISQTSSYEGFPNDV